MKPYNLPVSYRFAITALLLEAVILFILFNFDLNTLEEHMGPHQAQEALISHYLKIGMVIFSLSIVLFAILDYLFRKKLISISGQIENGHLRERNDEFAQLARTFNQLIEKESNKQAQLRKNKEQLEEKVIERTKELEESEKLFRAMFDQTVVGVALTCSATGKLLRVNNKYCEITGYTAEQLKKNIFQKISHPDDLELDLTKMQELRDGKTNSYSIEKRYIRPDGAIVWANLTVFSISQKGEKQVQHIGIIQDITERKVLEDEIKTLQGIIPICSSCKKIRDDKGYWNLLESYIEKYSDALFSHGICPDCSNELYGDKAWYTKMKNKKDKK